MSGMERWHYLALGPLGPLLGLVGWGNSGKQAKLLNPGKGGLGLGDVRQGQLCSFSPLTLTLSCCLLPAAKKLPKSEPQSTSGAAGRPRGVDLHEQSQQNKSQCCSN